MEQTKNVGMTFDEFLAILMEHHGEEEMYAFLYSAMRAHIESTKGDDLPESYEFNFTNMDAAIGYTIYPGEEM